MRICLMFTTMLAMLMSFAVQAYAGKFVEFESGAGKANQTRIIGYLARPQGSGPFPAVVVLHGCGGFHEDMLAWADRLRRWGYVALAVDSFGPRGIETACGSFGDQPADAFQALAYLKTQPYVRADHVAVLGFSMGGASVLAVLEKGSISELFPDKFAPVSLFIPRVTAQAASRQRRHWCSLEHWMTGPPRRRAKRWPQGAANSASHDRPATVPWCN
jgi:dienelactone hydrolase